MRRRGQRARGGTALVTLSALLALGGAGCGGDGGTGNGTITTTGSGSSTTTSTTSSTTTTEDPRPKNIIAWILDLGIRTPAVPVPPYFAAYEDLQRQRCDDALKRAVDVDGAELVAAAAAACLAAGNGDEKLWEQAEAAAGREPAAGNCLDAAVHALLHRLLTAHQQHPDRTFEFSTAGSGGGSQCPRIDRIEPSEGAVGDQVRIVGDNLDLVTDVRVHGVPVEVTRADGALLIVIPDPGGPVDAADIVLVTGPEDLESDRETFRFVSPTETSTGTQTTETTTTTGSQATETTTGTTGSAGDG